MKKGILLLICFLFGNSVVGGNFNYEQKMYNYLDGKYEDIYLQLNIVNKMIEVGEKYENKELMKALKSIKKVILIEIIDEEKKVKEIILGKTRNGNEVKAYYRGNPNENFVLFTANIHGGYEYGTYLTAVELRKKLESSGKKGWMIIETLNPDGLEYYFGVTNVGLENYYLEGRANSNGVDLNRNFCTESYESDESYFKEDTELFTGKFCGQEREVKMIEELLLKYNFSSLIDIHSAGGILYIPENSFDDKDVIDFATKVDNILELKYYFKTSYDSQREKSELIEEYEVDSGGEGEFTGTLITYFYEETGNPAVLLELWGHGRIEEVVLNLSELVE